MPSPLNSANWSAKTLLLWPRVAMKVQSKLRLFLLTTGT